MKNTVISAILLLILGLIFVACGGSEVCESCGIYGHVTDYETGEDVANANVQLRPGGDTTLTGSDGMFEFKGLSKGDYSITVSKSGYTDLIDDFVITVKDRMVRRDVQIKNNIALPTLNTLEATNVKTTSAILNAEILTKGEPSYSKRGFVYALTSNPTLGSTLRDLTATVTKENTYSAIATGLELGKEYYVRGYAINQVGVAYSTNEVKVVPATALAKVITKAINNINIDSGSATFNGTIVDEGDPAYTERGFVYGTVHNPMVEDDTPKVATGSGTGDFSVNVRDLDINTVYYVRAYAINDKGVAYGEEVTLSFKQYLPYVLVPGTTLISAKADAGEGPWDSANNMCDSSTLAGFTDWRLPTKSELLTLYANKNYIGGFKSGTYWSSTQDSFYKPYCVDFSDGSVRNDAKGESFYIRCVRITDSKDCKDILNCIKQCQTDSCGQECLDSGNPSGRSEFMDLYNCWNNNSCQDYTCNECYDKYEACVYK